MLSKKRRVPRKLFSTTSSKSRSFHTTHFSLRVHRAGHNEPSRFSFVVSGKVAKTAVGRNTLRRRGYAAINAASGGKPGYTALFFARAGASTLPYKEVEREVQQLLKEAGIL